MARGDPQEIWTGVEKAETGVLLHGQGRTGGMDPEDQTESYEGVVCGISR